MRRSLVLLLLAVSCSTPDKATPRAASDTFLAPGDTTWTVSEFGYGPLRAGMTLAQVDSIVGHPLATRPLAPECDYVRLAAPNDSLYLMVIQGRLTRIDIRHPGVRTTRGIQVGDPEALVMERYAGRFTTTPHHYVTGKYVMVRPESPADSSYRIVFETNGKQVTTFRSGLMPSVGWIEGCG